MKDSRKIILVSTIVLLAVMFGFTFLKEAYKKSQKKSDVSYSPQPTKAFENRSDWTLFRNGYAFPLPPDWKNSSDRGGTAVLEPRDVLKNRLSGIEKISITILSDAKAGNKQFSTEREFTEWTAVKGEVQGTIQKLHNGEVDGQKSILVSDTSAGKEKWKIIVWVRKDLRNLYLIFDGVGTYGKSEAETITYITSNFTFVAPATAGKEGKN